MGAGPDAGREEHDCETPSETLDGPDRGDDSRGGIAGFRPGGHRDRRERHLGERRLYGTVVTPTSFKNPPPRSTDIIYSFGMNELQGQRSVSEAAPGDRDYNGGRWLVHFAFFTTLGESIHDADGDGIVDFELTNAEEVLAHEALGHLEIVDGNFYFVCPLLP